MYFYISFFEEKGLSVDIFDKSAGNNNFQKLLVTTYPTELGHNFLI